MLRVIYDKDRVVNLKRFQTFPMFIFEAAAGLKWLCSQMILNLRWFVRRLWHIVIVVDIILLIESFQPKILGLIHTLTFQLLLLYLLFIMIIVSLWTGRARRGQCNHLWIVLLNCAASGGVSHIRGVNFVAGLGVKLHVFCWFHHF